MAINDLTKPFGLISPDLQPTLGPITPPPMMPQAPQVLGDALSDKNRQLAIMLYGLGSAFRGQDPLQAGLGLQQTLQKQKEMKPMFPGQGMTNQFMNILLQGQQDESIRNTPIYKTAYDFLSQQKTETYINELGQTVTRKVPSIIQQGDYLPPIGFDFDAKPEEKPSEVVQEVTPERRKTLTTNIDTLNNSLVKLEKFEQAVDEIQPGVFTFGEERAKIKSLHTSILLELKNLEELGVLAGPDLDLLLGLLGDPTSFQQRFTKGGVAGTKIQIQNIKNTIAEKKNRFNKELGIETQDIQPTQPTEPTEAYLYGRKIILNPEKTAWIYEDTGEPAQ
jgi:hypothetical protein